MGRSVAFVARRRGLEVTVATRTPRRLFDAVPAEHDWEVALAHQCRLSIGPRAAGKTVREAVGEAARAAGMRLKIAAKCVEPEEQSYFEEHVEPRLGPDVEWLGEVGGQDKLELLARARCLLFPIQWDEPFGLVMIESLACGTPVVSMARGSVPEVLEHGRTGLVAGDGARRARYSGWRILVVPIVFAVSIPVAVLVPTPAKVIWIGIAVWRIILRRMRDANDVA